LALLAVLAGTGPLAQAGEAAPKFVERMAERALLERVRLGGYVLYIRHGTTDNSRADQVPLGDFKDCSRQRVLNEAGRQQAVQVGQFFLKAHIPVSQVLHSPLCRARDTAQLAFPQHPGGVQQVDGLLYTGNLTQAEKQPVLKVTRYWLSEPVAQGANRVIVAHAPNMADLIGYFVRPEGTVVIIQPQGQGQFAYVATIPPKLWPSLLAP
jgi:phosphohistidine phosphatase SixA